MNTLPASILLVLFSFVTGSLLAQVETETASPPDSKLLNKQQWKNIDDSVVRGLEWLASKQQGDGSFEGIDAGQPAVTGFCLMAFLAKGENPVDGKYSQQLSKSIDYMVSQQRPNGLIAALAHEGSPISRKRRVKNVFASNAIVYNHAISALALSESYGQCDEAQAKILNDVIEKAIKATIEMQNWKRKRKGEEGGWKYIVDGYNDSADLSVTCWQLMFLRSARNAGFDVPAENLSLIHI